MISFMSVNAGSLISNQDQNLADLDSIARGNIAPVVILGNTNTEGTQPKHDFRLEYSEMHEDVYLLFDNAIPNSTMTMTWHFDLTTTETQFQQNFTFQENGLYVFRLYNNVDGEPLRLWADFDDTYVGQVYIQQATKRGFGEVMEGLISKVTDLMTINLSIWTMIFYLFILIIVLGGLAGLVYGAYLFYTWAKKHPFHKKGRSRTRE